MSNQELVQAGNKTMDETDQAIERSKQVNNWTFLIFFVNAVFTCALN